MKRFVFILIILLVVIACEKQEIADSYYAYAETLEPADYDSTGITLRGFLIPGHEKIEEFGFLITGMKSEVRIIPVESEKAGYFEFRESLSVYAPHGRKVQAYVKSNSFVSLGTIKSYSMRAFGKPYGYELSIDNITLSNATIFTTFYEIDYDKNPQQHIKDMGVVFHVSPYPTLETNSRIIPITKPQGIDYYYDVSQEYSCRLKGLSPATSYYARVYYRRKNGHVHYSDQINFTTKESYFNPGGGVVDVDGNHYQTVFISEQEWMAENLRTITFNNGDTIGQGHDMGIWTQDTRPLYSWYPHAMLDGLHNDEDVINAFGILYNGYTVRDERGICPEGWRMPSVDDWKSLINYIENETAYDIWTSNYSSFTFSGEVFALYNCQSLGHPDPGCQSTVHPRWSEPIDTLDIHDVFGLSIAPTGARSYTGEFLLYGTQVIDEARFWTSDHASLYTNHYVQVDDWYGNISGGQLQRGFSVRCVR